jgi:DNA-binding NarL/FixJ family response regulator
MSRIKTLVVDDHAIMRDAIRALLSQHDDIEIVGEASGGTESIKKERELAPDLVLMDIVMPQMNGIEATYHIKRKNPKVKILFVTQCEDKGYVLSAIKSGADGYVPKRALASELISAIRTVHQGDSFLHPSSATALIKSYQLQSEVEPYDRLTTREREVLKLISEGYNSRKIAAELSIKLNTVTAEIIKYATRVGLVSLDRIPPT